MRSILLAALALPLLTAAAPEPGPAEAKALVQRYYAAIERGDFRSAYLAWDHQGSASGKSLASFRQGFAATAHSRVVTGTPLNGDAGMSQRWLDVPVDVYATLKNGTRQHFRGRYTLHRIAPGVSDRRSDEQWHIAKARLVAVR
jgi:hypothetical protein